MKKIAKYYSERKFKRVLMFVLTVWAAVAVTIIIGAWIVGNIILRVPVEMPATVVEALICAIAPAVMAHQRVVQQAQEMESDNGSNI